MTLNHQNCNKNHNNRHNYNQNHSQTFDELYIKISIKNFAIGTLLLPLLALIVCLSSALLFSSEDILKTDCGVS